MIERAAIDFAAGRSRIFINGAILPNGCAASVQEVFEAMVNVSSMPSRVLTDRVRGASIAKGNTWCEMCRWAEGHQQADGPTRQPVTAAA